MSKRRSSGKGILAGVLAGVGLAGIAAGVAGLAVASKKAKAHNQTTKEYIAGKARKMVKKKKTVECDDFCEECGNLEEDCVCRSRCRRRNHRG
jgi:gas vesicle protein